MKRLISLLLSIVIIITAGSFQTFAVDESMITLTVENVSVHLGESQVAVDISMQGNTGISGFSFCVNHSNDLTFTGAEIAIDGGYKVVKEVPGYGVNLAWTNSENYTENGKLCTLHFDISSDVGPGNLSLGIIFRDGYDSIYKTVNGYEMDIPVQLFDGVCSIVDSTLIDLMTVSIGSVQAHAGDTSVAVPINIVNNTGFSGFSFCVNYDKSRLDFVRGEIAIADGYKVVNHPYGYDIALAWTSGTDFAGNDTIAYLYFNVLDTVNLGESLVQIVFRENYDSFYKTVNYDEQDIPCTSTSGCVEIKHFFGDWTTTKAPTCLETGVKERMCQHDGCEETEEVIIPQLMHDYSEVITAPSCQAKGYTTYTCKHCGDSFVSNYTDALNHIPSDFVRENEVLPSCSKEGSYDDVIYCAVCHEEISRVKKMISIDEDTHGETEIRDTKEATCCEDGYTGDTYCKDCNNKIANGSVIPATGHHVDADGKWESNETQHWHTCYYGTQFDVASHIGGTATCTQKAKCSVCGVEYGEYAVHQLTHHDRVEPDYENDGNIEYWTCDECSKYFSDSEGNNEISADDIIIAKLTIAEYQFLDGEVIIEAPEGAIPEGSIFDVHKIVPPPAEVVEKVKEQMGSSSEVLAYYEIRLSDTDGELIIHLDGEITIKIQMPEKYVGSKCVNVLQEDETGKLITMESWWEGEYLCYKTDWLEVYD